MPVTSAELWVWISFQALCGIFWSFFSFCQEVLKYTHSDTQWHTHTHTHTHAVTQSHTHRYCGFEVSFHTLKYVNNYLVPCRMFHLIPVNCKGVVFQNINFWSNMSNMEIYEISHVCPASQLAFVCLSFHLSFMTKTLMLCWTLCVQLFHIHVSCLQVTDTINFCHFIPLSVALTWSCLKIIGSAKSKVCDCVSKGFACLHHDQKTLMISSS